MGTSVGGSKIAAAADLGGQISSAARSSIEERQKRTPTA